MGLLLFLKWLHSQINNLIFSLTSAVLLDIVVIFCGNTQHSLIDFHLLFDDQFELHLDRGQLRLIFTNFPVFYLENPQELEVSIFN